MFIWQASLKAVNQNLFVGFFKIVAKVFVAYALAHGKIMVTATEFQGCPLDQVFRPIRNIDGLPWNIFAIY